MLKLVIASPLGAADFLVGLVVRVVLLAARRDWPALAARVVLPVVHQAWPESALAAVQVASVVLPAARVVREALVVLRAVEVVPVASPVFRADRMRPPVILANCLLVSR